MKPCEPMANELVIVEQAPPPGRGGEGRPACFVVEHACTQNHERRLMASSRLLTDENLKKTEDYLVQVVKLARESKPLLTNLKVRDLETVLKQIQAVRQERQAVTQGR